MTNVDVPLELAGTSSNIEYFEDKYLSKADGTAISFPKARTTVMLDGVEAVTINVDFNKFNDQMSLYQLNNPTR